MARVVYSRSFPDQTKSQTGRLNKSPHTVHALANRHKLPGKIIQDQQSLATIAGALFKLCEAGHCRMRYRGFDRTVAWTNGQDRLHPGRARRVQFGDHVGDKDRLRRGQSQFFGDPPVTVRLDFVADGGVEVLVGPLLRPERQVVGWFGIRETGTFRPDRFPVFVLTTPDGHFYGFPEHGVPGFKIGKYHHRLEITAPDAVRRDIDTKDEAVLRDCVRLCFPAADGPLLRASTCMFTNTPDEHFIIDRLPDQPNALVVSACSGHGFKFCSVVGEIVADLTTEGSTSHDLSLFRLDRFTEYRGMA